MKVLVLMSTYNGEKYICEQLDSIRAQRDVDVHLLIRDDGSSDETVAILRRYAFEYSNIDLLIEENIGCKYSFAKLARIAAEKYQDYDYYAFSDQDDVWLKDKLSAAVSSLESCKENIPLLYFCRYQLVDKGLNKLPTPYRKYNLTLGEALLIQPAAGCTMVFNYSLLKLFIKADPDLMQLHDCWIYKVCLATGGTVKYDPVPYILYRQHGNNVIGGNQSFLQKWIRRYKNFTGKERRRYNRAKNIQMVYYSDLTEEAKKLLNKVVKYDLTLWNKLSIVISPKFKTNVFTTNLLFVISILTKRF